ncbi:MAG: hypothetical protein IT318_13165 [Anaerolineales bacterium]|nr:hypothetical protein [Anaerolineales bacterium]
MSEPEFNWSLADAPEPGEPPPPSPKPPGRLTWRPPAGARAARRFWLTVALLLAVGAVAAWLVVQGGWQRLNDQLAAEAAYEDEHARAGDVELVLALQSTTAGAAAEWRERRAEEVALRLVAPLPAAHLTPDDAPPTLTEVETLGSDLFEATVVRAYHDSAGQPATFALPQRYRNLGPGLWERLPPDLSALQDTTVLVGQRLSATLPVEDLPWLSESLLAADQLVAQACAEWGDLCDPDWKLRIRFSGALAANPARSAPGPGAAAGLGPYPAAFDLAGMAPRLNQPLLLLSPHLAGLPQDDGARQALTHAFTVHGLGYLAGQAAGTPARRFTGALFRDALVARAELRLGLAPALTYTVRGEHYLPLDILWNTGQGRGTDPSLPGPNARADDLPLRLLALDFLNSALAGQPPTADAVLLAGLRRHPGEFELWLDPVLGEGGAARAASGWQAAALAAFNGGGSLDWRDLEGLAYGCGGETRLIRVGEALALPVNPSDFLFSQSMQAVSPDGRYLAYLGSDGSGQRRLKALDLRRGTPLFLANTSEAFIVGWSAGGALVTIERALETPEAPTNGLTDYRAWRIDIAGGDRGRLADDPVLPNFFSLFAGTTNWTPDGASVLLNGYYGRAGEQDLDALHPALLRVDPPGAGTAQRLPRSGYAALLSPDGRQVAYTVPASGENGSVDFGPVEVYDLATGTYRVLLGVGDLSVPEAAAAETFFLLPLAWSPDGQWLLVMALGENNAARLLAQPVAGGPPLELHAREDQDFGLSPLRFSADGRYLAYLEPGGDTATQPLRLLDTATFSSGAYALPEPLALGVNSIAWSPAGSRLALAGPGGVRLLDADSGQMRWLTLESCDIVSWYDLGS